MRARKPTRISTDIDYERDGKQTSYLRIPHSRNDSGGGTLMVPITTIKNGAGPTVLLTGGSHGDEYEGPVALMKLARELRPEEMRGRVIIIPALNLPAILAGQRLSPVDGKNMNRSFPGHRNGTITDVMAHYLSTQLLPLVDAVFDLHAGGKSMFIIPSVMMHALPDTDLMVRTLAALKAFRAPISMVIQEPDTDGMLDVLVEDMGKIFCCAELGGGGTLAPESVRVAETGVRNVLKHFDLIDGQITTEEWRGRTQSRMMEVPDGACYAMAMEDGIYEPLHDLYSDVEAGTPIGQIHFITSPERSPQLVIAETRGVVYARHAPGLVQKGDTVAILARDSTRF